MMVNAVRSCWPSIPLVRQVAKLAALTRRTCPFVYYRHTDAVDSSVLEYDRWEPETAVQSWTP